tara:strand:- start:442 stop:546 length:105 start_codon:yes stop_codon:yes gene_type:complete
MIEILIWSLIVITWASYGMHVLKEYVIVRLRDGE